MHRAAALHRLEELRFPFFHPALLGRLGLPQIVLGGLPFHGLDLHALPTQPQGVHGHVDAPLGVVAGPFGVFSLIVFLFPGGLKPSRVVFSAGKLSDFAGKKGKISASRDSTENCLLCCYLFSMKIGRIVIMSVLGAVSQFKIY